MLVHVWCIHWVCGIPLEQNSLHTQLLLLGNYFCNYTHISYTTLLVEELIYVMRVYLWCLLVFPLYYITERHLHNHNGWGVNIQLHAHQLHNNNCWGINCVIIPAPMVCVDSCLWEHAHAWTSFCARVCVCVCVCVHLHVCKKAC